MSIDWTEIYKKYAGQWVAIDAEDERTVLAADRDATQAYGKSQKTGKRGILHRVPEDVMDFVGCYEV